VHQLAEATQRWQNSAASEREANKSIHGESRRRQMNEAPRKLGFIH
jgi:hypothetical protein|tara:strand:- start:1837 stop:1974 length:138 start_codon:yes stop_codon:yes gene_type:complete